MTRDEIKNLDWEKVGGLIPAIIQDKNTLQVLMLGYMSSESLEKTFETGKVTFFSRTKNRLWTKGEESGNFLNISDANISIEKDCDNDTILIKSEPVGNTCHLGNISCFGKNDASDFGWLGNLEKIIANRYENPDEKSYTSSLFKSGVNRMAQKVGEEGVETALAAATNSENFLDESADLIFHLMVLLKAKNKSLNDVTEILKARHKK
ncbi:MAG: bifunctional phosphoribosyl-AMP cyclohydrolase/phosphoribosyl-ATP diphosphatase HisIE [Fusobacteriaceae bacterium]